MCLLVTGALLVFYGLAIRAVGSGTLFYIIWMAGGGLCLLAGALLRRGVLQKMPPALAAGLGILAVLVLVVLAVCTGLILTGFSQRGTAGADYLIVLGAQVRREGPSRVLQYRLDEAADYLQENPGTFCVVSGAQGPNEPCSEARGMADYLVDVRGIDAGRILLEEQSVNTVENILRSKTCMEEHAAKAGKGNPGEMKVCIVTNNFHIFRALAIAKKQGLANAVGLSAGSGAFYLPNNILRECAGLIKDKAAGNL